MKKESDLFEPVKKLLERQGFRVQGEVKNIDVFALKNSITLAVELKLQVSLKLIYQVVDRLKVADLVYVALPQDALKKQRENYHYLLGLLRKLEIGLITVQSGKAIIVIEARPFDGAASKRRNQRRKQGLVKEMLGRGDTVQVGGVQGRRMTAYRLRVMKIQAAMEPDRLYTPKEIKTITGVEDAYAILHHNYYGWFKKVSRGHYALVSEKKSLQ